MIINRTRNTVLCRKLETANSVFKKANGLMFRRSLKGGFLMRFERDSKPGIWTFGMFFPIDIAWIDSRGRVVKAKENAKPWRFLGYPKKPARAVLELNAGTLKKTKTRVGDTIRIYKRGGIIK